jgi:hypothetical protein
LRCYLLGSRVVHDLDQHYPVLTAPTGSCAEARSSVSLLAAALIIPHQHRSDLEVAFTPASAVAAGEAVQQFERGAVERAERFLKPVGDHPPQQVYGEALGRSAPEFGPELQCAKRKFISLNVRQYGDLPAPAQTWHVVFRE